VVGSTVTGVHTTPPPARVEPRRHSVPAGGIVQNGLGQAGRRSLDRYAITKPRTPYSDPAAPKITVWSAQIGALVSE
jgi:hypothetical protein